MQPADRALRDQRVTVVSRLVRTCTVAVLLGIMFRVLIGFASSTAALEQLVDYLSAPCGILMFGSAAVSAFANKSIIDHAWLWASATIGATGVSFDLAFSITSLFN